MKAKKVIKAKKVVARKRKRKRIVSPMYICDIGASGMTMIPGWEGVTEVKTIRVV